MNLTVRGIPTEHVRAYRVGRLDANGQPPIHSAATELLGPCRHCMQMIAGGEEKLVLSYRPFEQIHPYSESGPIFLHAHDCQHYETDHLPSWFARQLSPAIIRGYGHNDWIMYETGAVVEGAELTAKCHEILANNDVAYVHIRSKFSCYQCRVDRA